MIPIMVVGLFRSSMSLHSKFINVFFFIISCCIIMVQFEGFSLNQFFNCVVKALQINLLICLYDGVTRTLFDRRLCILQGSVELVPTILVYSKRSYC